jgi:fibronectin type III domain protein
MHLEIELVAPLGQPILAILIAVEFILIKSVAGAVIRGVGASAREVTTVAASASETSSRGAREVESMDYFGREVTRNGPLPCDGHAHWRRGPAILMFVVLGSLLLHLPGCVPKANNPSGQADTDEPPAQIRLTWTPSTTKADGTLATDVAGYRIYYGQASGKYSFVKTVGHQPSAGIVGLVPGRTYYFAVAAYDTAGTESSLSNEVSVVAPSTVPRTPILMQDALTQGQEVQFWVVGATLGEVVSFLFSDAAAGAGPCSPQLGGLCVDIVNPMTFGEATADASGTAVLRRTFPPAMPLGHTISTQAVIKRGPDGDSSVKTNVITAKVIE